MRVSSSDSPRSLEFRVDGRPLRTLHPRRSSYFRIDGKNEAAGAAVAALVAGE